MDKRLEKLVKWVDVEGIQYADIDNPFDVLGKRETKYGLMITTFVADAIEASLRDVETQQMYPMELLDEMGYFAVIIKNKKIKTYQIVAKYPDGNIHEFYDAYQFNPALEEIEYDKFNSGINYNAYDLLGAHVTEIDGVKGVRFAVWAPNAKRVSVVGDFNFWDGRRNIMTRHGQSGIFELFIPDIKPGEIYKYEMTKYGNLVGLKSDPYAFCAEKRPANASVVFDIENFKWTDDKWISERKNSDIDKLPISIYEVHLGSWKKPEEEDEFYNYREIAPMLAEYVLDMGYTHIELMPVMEHPYDGSWGYQVTGYYAPTARYGTPKDFMYFMDYMHAKGIGVIIDWVPAHFPKDDFGLARFDGTCLYEHVDPRKGEHPHWGTLIYNYGRPEVSNFLIANAMFWSDKYHVDGIRMDAVASMLYLDYGKNDGEWIANIYGGNENLEAIEFFKHLNSIFRKKNKGVMLIAEESTAWPKVTTSVEEEGLGFDYKWNMGWMNDFLDYMQCDPYFRNHEYGKLTFSMIYTYSENFILVFSHDEVVHGKKSLIYKMPGDEMSLKYANLRLAYGYQMVHPGKKLLFMGQEFAMENEWWEAREIDWHLLENEDNKKMQQYVKDLNSLYKDNPALYKLDNDTSGFEWINNTSANESILVFARKSDNEDENLLVICNFDTIDRDNYKIGVPKAGKYKEIFNSDSIKYGGNGFINPRVKNSKKDECDYREDSLRIKVPALGVSVFKYAGEIKAVAKKSKMR